MREGDFKVQGIKNDEQVERIVRFLEGLIER